MSAAARDSATSRVARALACAAALALCCQPAFARGFQARDPLTRAADLIRQGQLEGAEAELNAALAAAPANADALNLLGVVRASQRRAGDAEQLFRRALAASPKHLGAHVNLGQLYASAGRPDQALEVLSAAHALAPDHPGVNTTLAVLHGDRGEHERAIQHLRAIPRSAAGPDYFPLLLRSLLALDRREEARALAAEFKNLGGDPAVQAEFAMLLADGGLTAEALDVLEAAHARAPEAYPLLYALGVVNSVAGQNAKAEDLLTRALRARPDSVPALRALARVARAAGDDEKALAHLVRARRLAPNAPGVLYDFGAAALGMNLVLDAIPAFEQLHNAYPKEPAYVYALAMARFRRGDKTEAERLVKSYVEMRPRDPAGFHLLAAVLHSLSQFAAARSAAEKSLELKADPDVEYLYGLILQAEGNRAAAVEALRRVVGARPGHALAHAALGTAYRDEGKFAEARAALERAVELDPKDLRASYQLGLVYAKLGEKEAAKKMFERADALRAEHRERETVVLKLIDPPQD